MSLADARRRLESIATHRHLPLEERDPALKVAVDSDRVRIERRPPGDSLFTPVLEGRLEERDGRAVVPYAHRVAWHLPYATIFALTVGVSFARWLTGTAHGFVAELTFALQLVGGVGALLFIFSSIAVLRARRRLVEALEDLFGPSWEA